MGTGQPAAPQRHAEPAELPSTLARMVQIHREIAAGTRPLPFELLIGGSR